MLRNTPDRCTACKIACKNLRWNDPKSYSKNPANAMQCEVAGICEEKFVIMDNSELRKEIEKLIEISNQQKNIIPLDAFNLKRKQVAEGKVIAYMHVLSLISE